ncbi:hypothetical protein QR685DRAFT_270449 [Neurospora intermedia]|uniref:Uncharacterized protein n=1 Tax=Neurospora intermedia TaxID=5142 RepID=A0ABR3DF33_NEUIN
MGEGERPEEGKRCGSAMSHAPPMLLLLLLLLLTHITPAQQQQHSEPTEDTLLEAPSPRGKAPRPPPLLSTSSWAYNPFHFPSIPMFLSDDDKDMGKKRKGKKKKKKNRTRERKGW